MAPAEPPAIDIVVASLAHARKHKRRFDAVITLEDPNCRNAKRLRFTTRPAPPHLVLAFEDVDDDTLQAAILAEQPDHLVQIHVFPEAAGLAVEAAHPRPLSPHFAEEWVGQSWT